MTDYEKGAADKAEQARKWLKQNAWRYLEQEEYSEDYTIDVSKLCADFKEAMWFDSCDFSRGSVQGLFDGAFKIDVSDACVDGVLVPDDELGEPYA